MEFADFKYAVREHFNELTSNANMLFITDVDKDKLWEVYLDSFPAGSNEVYRERREHDCSSCRHFVKDIGAVVVLKDGVVHTIWEDVCKNDGVYGVVAKALDTYVKSRPIRDVWLSETKRVGVDKNHEMSPGGHVHVWEHLCVDLPTRFVLRGRRSMGQTLGAYRDTRNVFKRSLDEITMDAVDTVLELITQGSLYRGEEWKAAITKFKGYKSNYDMTPEKQRDIFAWENFGTAGDVVGRMRNHSIGVLLVDISNGVGLDEAVRRYEQIVAPTNYKRPKAIFTKKMLEDAQRTIEELGYMDSLSRRFATLDDISVNNILFANRDAGCRMSGKNVFDEMMGEVSISPKKFSKVGEMPVDKFIKDVLPAASDVELFLEGRHASNMVSLIAPKVSSSKTMFKWDNGFSWAYAGNIADSDIKANVKSAGGAVDGRLRFSIQWNDGAKLHNDDLDAHCKTPKSHIYFSNKRDPGGSGAPDVDIIFPQKRVPAVENITWPYGSPMAYGNYEFYVHCYSHRSGTGGFRAEIEFDGNVYQFSYDRPMRTGETVKVADVFFDGKDFTLKEKLSSNMSSREMWGLHTNQFVPVSVIMYSPNYWDEQSGVGNKHYFFMLDGCKNPDSPNGFYNEFLKQELVEHKRVFEALGSKMAVDDADDQLSGVGFSSTRENSVIVKVKGATERIIKVVF